MGMTLATGKEHISYSESKDWRECSYRHKLKHIDKIDKDEPKPHLDFGQAFHGAMEEFLKNRQCDIYAVSHKILSEAVEKNKTIQEFQDINIEDWSNRIVKELIPEAIEVLDKEIPGWQFIEAEEKLFESLSMIGIEKHADVSMKGMIDAVLSQEIKGKKLYWLIDWKTANRHWGKQKLMDPSVTSQLAIYKQVWAAKHNIPLDQIRCAFLVVNKEAKRTARCRFHKISVGPTTVKKSLTVITNMVSSIKRGVAVKNKSEWNCKFCPYKGTQYCP